MDLSWKQTVKRQVQKKKCCQLKTLIK
jgi:hypothetical protein